MTKLKRELHKNHKLNFKKSASVKMMFHEILLCNYQNVQSMKNKLNL